MALREQGKMELCLGQELIDRYIAGKCSPEELHVVTLHLGRCEKCRFETESKKSNVSAPNHANPVNTKKISERDSQNTLAFPNQDFEETRILPTEIPDGSIPNISAIPSGKEDFAKSSGAIIEGYEIIEEMPRGGQAIVYKAIHIATKTHVAIKVLLPTLLASARARYYFEREAEMIASLDHPNIVGIRDSGIIHHQYYFIMQYIEGEPLDTYILSEKLSFRERIILFNKICAAVSYAHQQGIIHRDLKFANILVDKRGEPHILDFGLAKAIGLSEKDSKGAVVTVTGQLAGTLSTMSPEQAAGRPDLIDVRTDVYSLGIILYRMLTGEYPYDVTGSTLEVLKNIQQSDPVRPRQIIRKFDSDIEAILLTALEKEPDKRYHSAADLRSDIENWMNGRPIRVRSISTMYLVRKIITRHRYTSTVAALLLLIILAFAYVSFDLYLQAKKAQRESEAIAAEWAKAADSNLGLARELAFSFFLQYLEQGRSDLASWTRVFLTGGSKEKKGANFLLNPAALAEKEKDFRQSIPKQYEWFADFVIGEHYLRDGNKTEALKAYKRSFEAVRQQYKDGLLGTDSWLAGQVRDRLERFDTANSIIDNNNTDN
jgi:hypothetical protein